jgi:pimeloyl-ACP methyl ester carboxylesterase
LTTFEYTANAARKPHSILFVGGLGDGLGTTSYTADLVHALSQTEWSLFSLTLTSSYQSWGLGHLDRDTDELAQAIRYIKDYKTSKFGDDGKIVLMGHSTGSQMVLHYLSRSNPHTTNPSFDSDLTHLKRLALDGAIMQAPISDRECIKLVCQHGFRGNTPEQCQAYYEQLERMAKEYASKDDQTFDTLLPIHLTYQIGYPANTPLSARRFLSLVSPESPHNPSEDDVFSSDLSDEQLAKSFGMIQKQGLLKNKMAAFYSGADQAVPEWVDKAGLMKRWGKAANAGGDKEIWDDEHTAVVPNASHALSNDDQGPARKLLVEKILGYLNKSTGSA